MSFSFTSLYTLVVLASAMWLSVDAAYPHQRMMSRQVTPPSTSCVPLDIKDATKLPSWRKVKQYVDATFGEGVQSIELNSPEYPDQVALACLKEPTSSVAFEAAPKCVVRKVTVEGVVNEAKKTITFVEEVGQVQKTAWSIVAESLLGTGAQFSVTLVTPRLGEKGAQQTITTGSFVNTLSDSFETVSSTVQEKKLEFLSTADGKQCKFELVSEACTAASHAVSSVVAKGVAIVKFPVDRPRLDNPTGPKKSTWFINLEIPLSEGERTSDIHLQGPIDSLSHIGYETDCVPTTGVTGDAPTASGRLGVADAPA